jgi:transposase
MVIIGVDPHKRTHTASALEPGSHRVLATLQIEATLAGYRQLERWAARFDVRRWAVENARGLGRHLAQWLAARGEQVDDVPCTATARVRELSRGGRRKNDVIDAAAAASVGHEVQHGPGAGSGLPPIDRAGRRPRLSRRSGPARPPRPPLR